MNIKFEDVNNDTLRAERNRDLLEVLVDSNSTASLLLRYPNAIAQLEILKKEYLGQ
jgi:hypothetical protein